MVKMKLQCLIPILVCLTVLLPCFAAVDNQIKFKMTAPVTEIAVGETVDVTVWGRVDSAFPVAGNGLDSWQMNLDVDIDGVVNMTTINLIAPDPDQFSGWTSMNNPLSGQASSIGVSQNVLGAPSETGVGGYSELFTFTIEGLANNLGPVTYNIGGDGGGLFAFLANGEWFENTGGADGGIYFDAAASDNVFNVTPEPCSLMIMSGLSVLALRRRRHC